MNVMHIKWSIVSNPSTTKRPPQIIVIIGSFCLTHFTVRTVWVKYISGDNVSTEQAQKQYNAIWKYSLNHMMCEIITDSHNVVILYSWHWKRCWAQDNAIQSISIYITWRAINIYSTVVILQPLHRHEWPFCSLVVHWFMPIPTLRY